MIDPKSNNIFNNTEVNNNLRNIIKSRIFSNGYIFHGPEGIGKKTTAIQFIQDIFNLYKSETNVESKIKDNNHPDFLFIEPTYFIKGKLINRSDYESPKNNKATIRIDQIRNIKNFLSKKSLESEKKIILIVDAHLINEAGSNCLLKILEEPTNGIFILLTSKVNLLLDTIISRCQLVRFKSFSYKQLKVFIQDKLDIESIDIDKELNYEFIINSANGSPGKLIDDIKIWNEIPQEIKNNLNFPLKDILEIFKISKFISEKLEIYEQIFLINILQNKWWRYTKNSIIIKKLEILKSHISNYIQPRLAWEVILLEIANEDF